MNLSRLRSLLRPIRNLCREDFPVLLLDGSEVVFTLQVTSAAEDADVARIYSGLYKEIIEELRPFVNIENGNVVLRYQPELMAIQRERVESVLESMKTERQLLMLSRTIVAINGEEIPAVVEGDNGERLERHEAVYPTVADLPGEIVTYLILSYHQLLTRTTLAATKDSKVIANLQMEAEILASKAEAAKDRLNQERGLIRAQVNEYAQGTKVADPVDSDSDIPEGARTLFEQERTTASAPPPAPVEEAPQPAPTPSQAPAPALPAPTGSMLANLPLAPSPRPTFDVTSEPDVPSFSVPEEVLDDSPPPPPPPARSSLNPRFVRLKR